MQTGHPSRERQHSFQYQVFNSQLALSSLGHYGNRPTKTTVNLQEKGKEVPLRDRKKEKEKEVH